MSTIAPEVFIQSKKGFMVQITRPAQGEALASLILVHGMGEHPGRFSNWAEDLASTGITTFRYPQQGHEGRKGKRGHCLGLDSLMDDLDSVLELASVQQPIFLLGHSMGGTVVSNYILRRKPAQVAGVILSSPYFKLAFQPPAWKMALANAMNGIWPSLTQPTGLNVNHISRIPDEVHRYTTDPFIHDQMSVAFFQAIHPAGQYALTKAQEWGTPILIGHGLRDAITSSTASQQFYSDVPNTTFKKSFWVEQGYHELHHEPERAAWLQEQVKFVQEICSGACSFPF